MFAGLYAFCADAADYGEWKFGVRSEGLMASSQSIGSKIGIGFGSACTAWILAAAGYVQGGIGETVTQPASVVSAIRFDYGWFGAIVSVILLIGVLCMDVEKYLPEIRKSIGGQKRPE
jgi:GPH family glycoside/pentoside/hexuronide:cation symporter